MADSHSTKPSLRLLIVVAIIALVTWYMFAKSQNNTEGAVAVSTPQQEAATNKNNNDGGQSPPLRIGCFFEAGDTVSYHINTRSKGFIDHGAMAASEKNTKPKLIKALDTQLDLNMHLRHVHNTAEEITMAVKFEAPKSNDLGLQELWSSPQFTTPFYLKFNTRCAIQKLGFSSQIETNANALKSSLIKSLEIHFAKSQSVDRWTTTQSDQKGKALVQYRRMQSSEFHFGRKRVTYIDLWKNTQNQFKRVGIGASKGRFEADKNGKWIRNFKHNEVMNLFSESRLLAREEVTIKLDRTASNSAVWKNWQSQLASANWLSGSAAPPVYTYEPVEKEIDESLTDMTPESVLDEFFIRLGQGQVIPAWEYVAAYLRARPEMAEVIKKWIYDGRVDDKNTAHLVLALEKAGTAQSVKALKDMLIDPNLAAVNRLRAAAALPDVKNLSEDILVALEATSTWGQSMNEDEQLVASSALIAIGTLEHRATEKGNKELSKKAVQSILNKLDSDDRDEELTAMTAIGNSGNQALLDALLEKLNSDNPLIRERVGKAIVHMDPELTASIFGPNLLEESEAKVRLAWVNGFETQAFYHKTTPPNAVIDGAIQGLNVETNIDVRLALIKLIGSGSNENKAAKQALIAWFSKETNAKALKLIGSFVSANEL